MRFIAFGVLLLTSPVLGWNDTGHKVVALIAYERLDPAVSERAVELLRKHDKFERDFVRRMPRDVERGDAEKQSRWMFMHAATWPDIARSYYGKWRDEYHHPTWHYINQPLFLNDDERAAFDKKGGVKNVVNLGLEWKAGMEPGELNVVQAMEMCVTTLKSKDAKENEKALCLSWLIHLVGDVHQPCHSAALFTMDRFPKGDRGGNEIPLEGGKSLHSTWDALLGNAISVKTLNGIAKLRDGEMAIGVAASMKLDFATWVNESHDLAMQAAYAPSILVEVERMERYPDDPLTPIKLPEGYYEAAREVARERVIEAGFRLAAVLNAALKQ